MSLRSAHKTGIGAGASLAFGEGGEALTRTPATQLAMDGPQRVRALGRATRSAKRSGWRQIEDAGWSLATRSPYAPRCWSEKRLQLVGSGPSLLTEDRQKPSGRRRVACELGRQPRLDGWHGTRNTVPSRALTKAVEGARCRPQRQSWMEHRLWRPGQPELVEDAGPVLAHSTPRT